MLFERAYYTGVEFFKPLFCLCNDYMIALLYSVNVINYIFRVKMILHSWYKPYLVVIYYPVNTYC